jgi:hypothetical protein
MVKRTTRTATERKLIDQIAADHFVKCLTEVNAKSPEGCAQLAFDVAEAFIAERRKRLAKH